MDQQGIPRIPAEIDIPLAQPLTCRDGLLTKDSQLVNCYVEPNPTTSVPDVRKRSGLELFTNFNGGGAAISQGLWFHNGFLLAASGNNLTRISGPTSLGYTTAINWNNTFNGPWKARANHATVVFNNALFVVGGVDSALALLSDVWSSVDGQNWQQLVSGAPWGPRSHMQLLVFNNRLYLIGGTSTTGFYNDVWVTDDGVTWTLVTGSAGWSQRSGFACVVYNNGMWVLGGNSGANLNDVWFSTDGTNWVQMIAAAGWAGRSQHRAVVFQNRIYVIGGSINGREVWYTSDGIVWTQATAAAFGAGGLYGFGCTVYNGSIWAMCGFDGAVTDDVWSSADGATWTLVSAAFGGAARIGASLNVFQSPPNTSVTNAPTLYLTGGQPAAGPFLNQIWWSSVGGILSTTYVIPSPLVTAERMQAVPVNDNRYFFVKDTTGAYIWYANEVVRVVDPNYPPLTVPGAVNLDETVYVMDEDAIIYGSAIANPYVFPAFNFIGADFRSDGGVALTGYGNFVMALGNSTMQLFYNSGAFGGSKLRPVKNANITIGCAFPYSVVEFETTVLWIGRTESNQRSVYMMSGMTPVVVSTPTIDRAINDPLVTPASEVKATSYKLNGHPCYILSITGFLYSFVFDLLTKEWYLWGSNAASWPFNFYATDGTDDYTLQDTVRSIFTTNPFLYQDNGIAIISQIQTKNIDNNTNANKFCNRITIEGDRVASCTFNVQFSDDDYQTYSTPVSINMDQDRATSTRFGSYRRRAWLLSHNGNTNFRVRALRTELRIGNN